MKTQMRIDIPHEPSGEKWDPNRQSSPLLEQNLKAKEILDVGDLLECLRKSLLTRFGVPNEIHPLKDWLSGTWDLEGEECTGFYMLCSLFNALKRAARKGEPASESPEIAADIWRFLRTWPSREKHPAITNGVFIPLQESLLASLEYFCQNQERQLGGRGLALPVTTQARDTEDQKRIRRLSEEADSPEAFVTAFRDFCGTQAFLTERLETVSTTRLVQQMSRQLSHLKEPRHQKTFLVKLPRLRMKPIHETIITAGDLREYFQKEKSPLGPAIPNAGDAEIGESFYLLLADHLKQWIQENKVEERGVSAARDERSRAKHEGPYHCITGFPPDMGTRWAAVAEPERFQSLFDGHPCERYEDTWRQDIEMAVRQMSTRHQNGAVELLALAQKHPDLYPIIDPESLSPTGIAVSEVVMEMGKPWRPCPRYPQFRVNEGCLSRTSAERPAGFSQKTNILTIVPRVKMMMPKGVQNIEKGDIFALPDGRFMWIVETSFAKIIGRVWTPGTTIVKPCDFSPTRSQLPYLAKTRVLEGAPIPTEQKLDEGFTSKEEATGRASMRLVSSLTNRAFKAVGWK